jgi:hypothetical protein
MLKVTGLCKMLGTRRVLEHLAFPSPQHAHLHGVGRPGHADRRAEHRDDLVAR